MMVRMTMSRISNFSRCSYRREAGALPDREACATYEFSPEGWPEFSPLAATPTCFDIATFGAVTAEVKKSCAIFRANMGRWRSSPRDTLFNANKLLPGPFTPSSVVLAERKPALEITENAAEPQSAALPKGKAKC